MRKSKWFSRISLFAGMYAITASVITWETGSLAARLSLGLLGSTLKTGWAFLHGTIFWRALT